MSDFPEPALSPEAERLEVLRDYEIMDSLPEPAFDHLVALATSLMDVPVAMIALIGEDRQWFKARHGVDVDETPREIAFCNHVVESKQLIAVEDMRSDPRFASNPFVTGEASVRSYVGAPLRTECGEVLGTLCIIETRRVRKFSDSQLSVLQALADAVMAHMNTRRSMRKEKEARQKMERSLRAQQAFMSMTSHKLRTPVASMMGYADMIKKSAELEGQEAISRDARHIAGASADVLHVLDELLDLAKINSGHLELSESEFELEDLFKEVVAQMAPLANERGNELIFRTKQVRIKQDYARLKQVLVNLVDNANKFTHHGVIWLGATQVQESLILSVRDTGMGVSDTKFELLFEEFTQGRDLTSRSSGVGLGLSICKGIAEAMGASMMVESESGKGACFSLMLPASLA